MKLVKCKSCGKKVSVNAESCPKCGNPNISAEVANTRKNNAGCLKVLLIGFCIVVLGSIIISGIINATTTDEQREAQQIEREEREAQKEHEAWLKTPEGMLQEEFGFTESQSDKIIKLLMDDIGITKINSIEKSFDGEDDDGTKFTLYRFKASPLDMAVAILPNKSVYTVSAWQRLDMPEFYVNGNILHKIDELFVPNEEQTKYRVAAKDVVTSMLSVPNSAKFPWADGWKYGRRDGNTFVQGYVDSQNRMGVTLRSEFQLTFDNNDKLISFIFDGEEMIK